MVAENANPTRRPDRMWSDALFPREQGLEILFPAKYHGDHGFKDASCAVIGIPFFRLTALPRIKFLSLPWLRITDLPVDGIPMPMPIICATLTPNVSPG